MKPKKKKDILMCWTSNFWVVLKLSNHKLYRPHEVLISIFAMSTVLGTKLFNGNYLILYEIFVYYLKYIKYILLKCQVNINKKTYGLFFTNLK